jgi:hypothetical protein
MSSIKEHLENMEVQIHGINQDGHVTEPDEFVVVTDIEIAINDAHKVFERTKNIAKANND